MKSTKIKTNKIYLKNLGANTVEYALVMAIIVAMMITASQMLKPGVSDLFDTTGQKMIDLVNGGSSAQNTTTSATDGTTPSDDGGGFWGSAWNGAISTVKFSGNVIYGAGEGVYDLGAGVVTLGYDVVRLPFNGEVRTKYADAGRAIWDDPSLLVDAFVDPITDDWEQGNYGQAIGRGIFEIGSIVVAPTKVAKLGKLDEVSDVARIADNAGELGDVARITEGFYDPRVWRQNYDDFYNGNVTSTTVPPYSANNVHLAGGRHPNTGIVFDQRGFPIFDDIAQYDTRLPLDEFRSASYDSQMRMATRDLRSQLETNPQIRSKFEADQLQAIQSGQKNIPRLTWHHHQESGRMQLVPSDIHRRTGHIGGEAMDSGQ